MTNHAHGFSKGTIEIREGQPELHSNCKCGQIRIITESAVFSQIPGSNPTMKRTSGAQVAKLEAALRQHVGGEWGEGTQL